ncbi:hypothetical protein E2C01_056472 [Portunus trituberculatus]|uniref:Uncharacterized protein n=1 Tax=Portunus trituberculatus TaxID=210409 RepID=A0A5B7GZ93_PORTR|nr:hypothetical protein [Portunus trituberculatus]
MEAVHFNENCDPNLTSESCSCGSHANPFRTPSHCPNTRNIFAFADHSQDFCVNTSEKESDRDDSDPKNPSFVNFDTCAESEEEKQHQSNKIHQGKNFIGVRDLIDQWEEIVEKEKLRSLPASPAGGRRVMPPFEEKKTPELPSRATCEFGITKSDKHEDKAEMEMRMEDSKDGSSVVEQVASVGDIIQQFEGKFAQYDKQSVLRLKVLKSPQSPPNRGSPPPRQVATVKPLREFQLQEENKITVSEENIIRHPEDATEGSQMVGFLPRVMESLSITKSSLQAKEEDSPIAGVLYPEGELYFSVVCHRND